MLSEVGAARYSGWGPTHSRGGGGGGGKNTHFPNVHFLLIFNVIFHFLHQPIVQLLLHFIRFTMHHHYFFTNSAFSLSRNFR